MQPKSLKGLFGFLATAVVALMLVGCNGSQGQTGPAGPTGPTGPGGGPGPSGPVAAIDATTYTPEEWSELTLKGTITSVTMGSAPVVNFKITEGHNIPVKGLGFKGKNPTSDPYDVYLNMAFSVAKLVPGTNGSPNRWVNYIVTGNPTVAAPTTYVPGRPSTDNIGTLVDNGDGSYRYTFRRDITQTKAQLDAFTYTGSNVKADLDDVTYDASLAHRITAYVGGTAWGTGSNTANRSNSGIVAVPILNPANFLYDFIPTSGATPAVTATREITSVDKCFTCHAKFEFHGGGRQDTRYCVVCHTDQRKYGRAEATTTSTGFSGSTYKIDGKAVGDFPKMVHGIHMGEELSKTDYNYANVLFNHVTYPQDHRNCVKCHTNSTATPQGDNWFSKPSRLACGACHDKVNFATGVNHGSSNEGGPQLNDQNCVNCHDSAEIKLVHIPVLNPDPNNWLLNPSGSKNTNASYLAAFSNNLPAGTSKVTWDLNSVTLDATGKPVIKFRFLKDGVPVVFNTYSPTGKTELMDNFVGGPSIYVAFTVPYDGITYPADWNATISTYLKNIWRGDGKTMTGTALADNAKATLSATPDSGGYYTLTFTHAVIPATAGMITGGIGYTYNLESAQPLTQTNVPGFPYNVEGKKQGGVTSPAPNVTKIVSGTFPAGFDATQVTTVRRAIVSTQKCNDCHGALGVFTAKTYHAGQRNDAATCEFCHNGQRVNSGWGVNAKDFVHAIHGAKKRLNKFSWESQAGFKYWTITYPSVLNNCEACHVPGSYDFGLSANVTELPNLNWTTVATGTTPTPMNVIVTGTEPIPGVYWSQFSKDFATVANGGNPSGYAFGSGFSYNANPPGTITPAAITTLVSSPYVAACSNCHDSTMALNHMKANGGSFYVPRSSVMTQPAVAGNKLNNTEQCFLCHSSGKIADVRKVHMDFK